MIERELHPNLLLIKSMQKSLHQMLGKSYEVILHDLSHVESSVIGVEGNITGRSIGAPITNYVLQTVKKYGKDAPDCINYRTINKDGRILRSSTIFIRDDDGEIIGCLCFNQDLSDASAGLSVFQEMCTFNNPTMEDEGYDNEFFAHAITEVMENMVRHEIEMSEKQVSTMQREDKLAVVMKLEEKGIFDVKGSVDFVANCLGVSLFTVYNYLKEIRFNKK